MSLGLGWVLAGRLLRPINEMTATARRLSETNLHERIALSGPKDELKELADTFDAMLDRLEAAFESQRRFVADASHELRTPLSIIRAEVDVALASPDASVAELREMGETVREATSAQRAPHREPVGTGAQRRQPSPAPTTATSPTWPRSRWNASRATPDHARTRTHLGAGTSTGHRGPGLGGTPRGQPGGERGAPQQPRRLAQRSTPDAPTTSPSSTVENGGRTRRPTEVAKLTHRFHTSTTNGYEPHGFGLGLSIVESVTRTMGGILAARPAATGVDCACVSGCPPRRHAPHARRWQTPSLT